MFGKSIAIGITGWFAAAQFVKHTGLADPSTRWSDLSIYLVGAPIGTSFVVALRLLGIPPKDCFASISIGTATALILDGVATNLWPSLYTYQKKTPIEALSIIAYGAGCGMFAGYYVTKFGSYGF